MPGSLELDDDEKAALVELLRGILAKLGIGPAPVMPCDAPKQPGERSIALTRKRRR